MRSQSAMVIAALAAGLVVGGLAAGAALFRSSSLAAAASASTTAPHEFFTRPVCPGDDVAWSPESVTVKAGTSVAYRITMKDTAFAKLLDGSLIVSKPGTGYDSVPPVDTKGQPRFNDPANQVARLNVQIVNGLGSGVLDVPGLAPGVYPVTYSGHYLTAQDCSEVTGVTTANGSTHGSIAIVGRITVQ